MDKIKVAIVEDEFPIAEDIRLRLIKSGYEAAAIFDRAETALPVILRTIPDILLIDIRLSGKVDGITLVEDVRKCIDIPVIYITANSDKSTYERARKTLPSAFLVKPFTPETLLASIDLALYNFSDKCVKTDVQADSLRPDFHTLINQKLFIRVNGKHKKIDPVAIEYVQADGSYITLHTDKEQFVLSQNLRQFLQKTTIPGLIRVHRSYLVNISKVDSFTEDTIFLGRERIPVSESYRADFLKAIHCL